MLELPMLSGCLKKQRKRRMSFKKTFLVFKTILIRKVNETHTTALVSVVAVGRYHCDFTEAQEKNLFNIFKRSKNYFALQEKIMLIFVLLFLKTDMEVVLNY